MRFATYRFTPEISATTMISVETDSTIPSSIRNERILCARSVSSATPIGSRNWMSGFHALRSSLFFHTRNSRESSPALFHSAGNE